MKNSLRLLRQEIYNSSFGFIIFPSPASPSRGGAVTLSAKKKEIITFKISNDTDFVMIQIL